MSLPGRAAGGAAKAVLAPLRRLADCSAGEARAALGEVLAEGAKVQLCHPLGTVAGPEGFFERAIGPLYRAMPDLERRELIVIEGADGDGQIWVGVCGLYLGRFEAPFLGIAPTGRVAVMHFHEFYRIEEGRAVEVQAIWDLPELMMQAGLWPMSPSLGREGVWQGPATGDGLSVAGDGAAAVQIVGDMLAGLRRNREGAAAMGLEKFWHPRMNWYGPAGIGTARGIDGFRAQHQIPFLNAMPDRRSKGGTRHLFGQGNYVGFTAWPGMEMTLSGDGWLGIAPAGREITMRSLDFWRVEAGMIRENWVLVDLLDVYHQLGVDVMARMKEMQWNKGSA